MSNIKPIFSTDESGTTSFADEFKDKVHSLHEHFDVDSDKYLNFTELRSLQLATSGSDLTKETYVMICRALDCHPQNGISIDALRLTYAAEGTNVENDYRKVFAPPKGEDDTQTTRKVVQKDETEEEVIEIGDDGFDISPGSKLNQ